MHAYNDADLARLSRVSDRLPVNLAADLAQLRHAAAVARGEDFRAGLRAVGRFLAKLLAPVIAWRRYRTALAELNALDDRTLADIGIVRGDVPRVAAGLWMPESAVRATAAAPAAVNVNIRKLAA